MNSRQSVFQSRRELELMLSLIQAILASSELISWNFESTKSWPAETLIIASTHPMLSRKIKLLKLQKFCKPPVPNRQEIRIFSGIMKRNQKDFNDSVQNGLLGKVLPVARQIK